MIKPRVQTKDGYIHVYLPEHHLAQKTGYVREHLVIAERALGHDLPEAAVVHHHNENRADNANTNLVICENDAYHKYIHWLMRTNGGTERECRMCGKIKSIQEFSQSKAGSPHRRCFRCKPCRAEIYKQRYQEKINANDYWL